LGSNHDSMSSPVLVCDGEIVTCAEEERFSRVKHHLGFLYPSPFVDCAHGKPIYSFEAA